MGVWTEQRLWDHLPAYRPPACVPATGDQRRALTGMNASGERDCSAALFARRVPDWCAACAERVASPRVAATPAGELSSGLVIPDSTYPTCAGEQATLRLPTAEAARPVGAAAQQHSDSSAQENVASAVDNTAAGEQQETASASVPAGLLSCPAAMGHNTRTRVSACAAVVPHSPGSSGHPVAAAPDPVPYAAAGERRESCAHAAEAPAVPRKVGNVAARELGIVDFVAQMGRSRQSDAATHSAPVRRTRAACPSAPPLDGSRAAQAPTVTAATLVQPHSQRRDTQLSIEPVLDVHVPRAKRSVRGGCASAQKRLLPDAGDGPTRKRLKQSAAGASAACGAAARVFQDDSAEDFESDEDFDMKTTLAVQRRSDQNAQVCRGRAACTVDTAQSRIFCEYRANVCHVCCEFNNV